MQLRKLWLNINGADRMVVCDPEKDTLADLLRRLGLTGVKMGCGIGVCGVCSVLLDGQGRQGVCQKDEVHPRIFQDRDH